MSLDYMLFVRLRPGAWVSLDEYQYSQSCFLIVHTQSTYIYDGLQIDWKNDDVPQ